MKNNSNNIIQFYRACYQADLRSLQVRNFRGTKVEHLLWLESFALIEGRLSQYPVPTKWAEAARKELLLYSKEKMLYAGAFFLKGSIVVAGKKQDVLAPLWLIPASILLEKEVYYVELAAEQKMLNPAFVDQAKDSQQESGYLYEQLNEHLPSLPIQFDELHELLSVLEMYLPDLDCTMLQEYPKVTSNDDLLAGAEGRQMLVPALGFGFLPKAIGSRGVLNELEELANAPLSPPLQYLLGNAMHKNFFKKNLRPIEPISLSQPQKEIIRTAFNSTVSLIIGPPGTGKSFTIAALAVEFLLRGKSVLISSKTNQAVDVVAQKIAEDFQLKGVVIRAGRKDYKKQLKQKIENYLLKIGISHNGFREAWRLEMHLRRLNNQILQLQKKWSKQAKRFTKNVELLDEELNWLAILRKNFLKLLFKDHLQIWKTYDLLGKAVKKKEALAKKYVPLTVQNHLYDAVRNERRHLQDFLFALRARTGAKKSKRFKLANVKKVLHTLPVWLVSASEVSQALPLEKELFDIVIFDEATQCDISSALPLIQRGKKLVVVGDPKQLRHLSFLSREQQRQLAVQFQVNQLPHYYQNYRDFSLLDLVFNRLNDQRLVHFLDEHYRSLPGIINFSNKRFYDHQLKLMQDIPGKKEEKCVFFHHVDGKRLKRGHNKQEAETLINKVEAWIIAEERKVQPSSIGILSPFRSQVDYLEKQAEKRFSIAQIERHQLMIGSPYSFQGEERDAMFLSFAIDGNSHPSVWPYLNRPDVFNVSVTRAKKRQEVFLSLRGEDLPKKSLLAAYLAESQSNQLAALPLSVPSNPFTEEVAEFLKSLGVGQVQHGGTFAGIPVELLIYHNERYHLIDLVGYPGGFDQAIPLHQLQMLDRLGVRCFVLPYASWKLQPEKTKTALAHWLKN